VLEIRERRDAVLLIVVADMLMKPFS